MNKVLCVIDMQNDFITGPLGTPEAQAIVPKVKEKIENLDDETYIVFTRDTHYPDYLDTREGKMLPVPHCIKSTRGWEIEASLMEMFADSPLVIDKPTFGSFDLMRQIEMMYPFKKIDKIEFVGVCTGICVSSNALIARAYFPEAEISIDSSCCACVSPESHETALKAMELCQIIIK